MINKKDQILIVGLISKISKDNHLDYLQASFTERGTLVLKETDNDYKTLRDSKNKLCHNIKALDFLINEALESDKLSKDILKDIKRIFKEAKIEKEIFGKCGE